MTTEPQIEPVTDEDCVAFDTAFKAADTYAKAPRVAGQLLPGEGPLHHALTQDRRRVAERQAPEIERLRAKLAASEAACAAKDGWMDATGAVESTVKPYAYGCDGYYGQSVKEVVPDDWAGSRVLIVRVP